MKKALILTLLLLPMSSFSEESISFSELELLEQKYKEQMKQGTAAIATTDISNLDPKALELIANCSLAELSVWPVKIRIEILKIYAESESIFSANRNAAKRIPELLKKYDIKDHEKKFRYQTGVIENGCNHSLKNKLWIDNFKSIGIEYTLPYRY